MDDEKLLIKPESGDTVDADGILTELQTVLRKYGYALVHKENAILLGKVGEWRELRVIAHVKEVSPHEIVWRPISWVPRPVVKQ